MSRYLKPHSKVVLMAVSLLALAACSGESAAPDLSAAEADAPPSIPTPTPPPPPPVTTAPGQAVDVNNFQVGLCADDTFESQFVNTAIARDCNTEHDFQVAGFVQNNAPEGSDFPGFIRLRDASRRACELVFENYTGTAFLQSDLDLDTIAPNETTWLDGDREVICLIVTVDGEPLVSSAASAN